MITTIIVLSGLNIFFMFAYASELRRRDKFKDFMENWLNESYTSLDHYDELNEYYPEWIETERDTLKCLLKEFNK